MRVFIKDPLIKKSKTGKQKDKRFFIVIVKEIKVLVYNYMTEKNGKVA